MGESVGWMLREVLSETEEATSDFSAAVSTDASHEVAVRDRTISWTQGEKVLDQFYLSTEATLFIETPLIEWIAHPRSDSCGHIPIPYDDRRQTKRDATVGALCFKRRGNDEVASEQVPEPVFSPLTPA